MYAVLLQSYRFLRVLVPVCLSQFQHYLRTFFFFNPSSSWRKLHMWQMLEIIHMSVYLLTSQYSAHVRRCIDNTILIFNHNVGHYGLYYTGYAYLGCVQLWVCVSFFCVYLCDICVSMCCICVCVRVCVCVRERESERVRETDRQRQSERDVWQSDKSQTKTHRVMACTLEWSQSLTQNETRNNHTAFFPLKNNNKNKKLHCTIMYCNFHAHKKCQIWLTSIFWQKKQQ